ncbi:unnamed protein product [Phytophthora lilii]|uniref:Unnamed protein product n=1 Tax=Phytophthora lilii TaxID=2077276 RepID=A0A9W7DDB9_9STRA|nr:unnamed protein product [Phytophthora lilii]
MEARPYDTATQPQTTRQRAPKPKQTQRKTKVSKQVPKSARRQLAPGLNLADDSQSIDKDPTIVDAGEAFATEAEATFPLYSVNGQLVGASGARRPRLKRRTPAQKSGKLAVSEKRLPTPTTASTTPDHELPRIAEPNPAVGILNQGSLDSPVGCDEDPVASPSAHGPSSPKKPTEAVPIASQNAAKKSLLQKVRWQHSILVALADY